MHRRPIHSSPRRAKRNLRKLAILIPLFALALYFCTAKTGPLAEVGFILIFVYLLILPLWLVIAAVIAHQRRLTFNDSDDDDPPERKRAPVPTGPRKPSPLVAHATPPNETE